MAARKVLTESHGNFAGKVNAVFPRKTFPRLKNTRSWLHVFSCVLRATNNKAERQWSYAKLAVQGDLKLTKQSQAQRWFAEV